jgi:hypothetical protein
MIIDVTEIHPAQPGKKMARVVAADGQKFDIWPDKLAGIYVGQHYEVNTRESSPSPFRGRATDDQRHDRGRRHHHPAGAPGTPSSLPLTPPRRMEPGDDSTALRAIPHGKKDEMQAADRPLRQEAALSEAKDAAAKVNRRSRPLTGLIAKNPS